MQLTSVHITARRYLASIHVDLHDHLVADLTDAGHEPVILAVETIAFNVRHLVAVHEAIEHPMPTVLTRMCCYELQDRWQACSQTWRDCVELVGVCRHLLPIPARFLTLDGRPLLADTVAQGTASNNKSE